MEQLPLLAGVAALVTVIDLFTRRTHFRYFADLSSMGSTPRTALFLPLNTLAVAGAGALVLALHIFLAAPSIPSHAARRDAMRATESFVRFMSGSAAALLLGALVTAALQPFAQLEAGLVLIGTAAAQLLVSNVALAAMRHPAPFAVRAAAFLMLVAALGAFLGFMVPAAFDALGDRVEAARAGTILRRGGELAFLLVPASLAFQTGRLATQRRGLALAAAALAGVGAASFVVFGALSMGGDFGPILYGTLRLEAFAGLSPRIYAFPLGITAGLVALLAIGGDANGRQRAAGLALYVAAGYAPLSPALLLAMGLGAVLLSRSAIADSPVGRGYPAAPLAGPSRADESLTAI
jgi:hypothetical protein